MKSLYVIDKDFFFLDNKDIVLRWESSINVFVDFPKENIALKEFLPSYHQFIISPFPDPSVQ